jgi:3-isopropylmalate dehydrogenase
LKWTIAVLPGDGVGPEVTKLAVDVLDSTAKIFNHELNTDYYDIGWSAYKNHGNPLPQETLEGCKSADAVLLGAVGDPRGDELPPELRPERGLLALRKKLGCFANIRPSRLLPCLAQASPLTFETVENTDLVIVRELAGGIYYGEPTGITESGDTAFDTMKYHRDEIVRITRVAFDIAMNRKKKVVSVDKANVLSSSRLWRNTVNEIALEYPEIECSHMFVDRAAMELVMNPQGFDVLLTSNLFGDILSDEAAAVVGSIGLLASASLNEDGGGIFEPVHGSAPDIAGSGSANPLAAILSAAMLVRQTYSLETEASVIEDSVEAVLEAGLRTPDLDRRGPTVGTETIGSAVSHHILQQTL